jgi:hypothetical protein
VKPDRGQPLYTLNVVAGLVGSSPRTIRMYDETSLIDPVRTGGNDQRLYSEQDVQWLRCIRDMLHRDGLTVVAIRRLLDLIPCWEIRECAPAVAKTCRHYLRIPDMAEAGRVVRPRVDLDYEEGEPDEPRVIITLIYGVKEFGAALPCSRCISAERAARRVAHAFSGLVGVEKYDVLSPEAADLGVVLSPTVLVNDQVVVAGTGISEQRLGKIVHRELLRHYGQELANEEGGDS